MADSTLTVIVSVVLIALPLLWGVLHWARRRSARSLVRSIGLALIPAGLWILGVMGMVTQWGRQAVDWVRTTTMDTTRWTGVAMAGVGVLAMIAGSFIAPVTRQQARERRSGSRETTSGGSSKQVGPAKKPGQAPASKAGQRPGGKKQSGNPDKAGFTDEDRELMELLKERGID